MDEDLGALFEAAQPEDSGKEDLGALFEAAKPAMSAGEHPLKINNEVSEPSAPQMAGLGLTDMYNQDAAVQARNSALDEDGLTIERLRAEAKQTALRKQFEQAAPAQPTQEPSFLDKASSYVGRRVDDVKQMGKQFIDRQLNPAPPKLDEFGHPTNQHNILSGIDSAKEKLLDPVVAGWQQNRRAELDMFLREGHSESSDAAELLKRSAIQLILGREAVGDMSIERRDKAFNDLQDIFKSPTARALLGNAEVYDKIPYLNKFLPTTPEKQASMLVALPDEATNMAAMLLTGGGNGIRMAGLTPSTQQFLGEGLKGLKSLVALSAIQPGAKPTEAGVAGFVMGAAPVLGKGVFNAVAKSGSKAVRTATAPVERKLLGIGTSEFVDEIAVDISKMKVVEGPVVKRTLTPGETPKQLTTAVVPEQFVVKARHTDPKFKPGFSTAVVNPETGQLEARLIQHSPNGETKVYSQPIQTVGDAVSFRNISQKKGVSSLIMQREAGAHPNMTHDVFKTLNQAPEATPAEVATFANYDEDVKKFREQQHKDAKRDYYEELAAREKLGLSKLPEPVYMKTKLHDVDNLVPWDENPDKTNSGRRPRSDMDSLPPSFSNSSVTITETPDGIRLDPLEYDPSNPRDSQNTQVQTNSVRTDPTRISDTSINPATTQVRDFGDMAKIGVPIGGGSGPPLLPKDLRGAAPRYRDASVEFTSDLDKAVYILAQDKRSARDAEYLKFAMVATGKSERELRLLGVRVKGIIKDLYATGSDIIVPTVVEPGGPQSLSTSPTPTPPPSEAAPNLTPVQVVIPSPKPAPAPIPQQGELSSTDLTIASTVQAMAKQSAVNPSLYEKTMRQLIGSHVRGPKDLAQLAAIQKGIKTLEQSGIEVVNSIQKQFGKALTAQFENDLFKLAKAPNATEQASVATAISSKPYGQLFEKHKSKIYDLLRERDSNNQLLEQLGVTKEGDTLLREQGQVDAYVARSFMAYMLPPGQWSKIVTKNNSLMGEGIAWLRKENGLTDNSQDSDLANKLFDLIGSPDPFNAMQDPKFGIKSAQHLKTKQDLPPVLLKLLGEVESGSVALGISLGTQRALISNAMVWKEIAVRPDWAVPSTLNDQSKIGWQKLPDNKRWYGDASGMYVSPEIYDTMVTLPNTIENSKFLFQNLIGFVKAMEVAGGGAGPWVNNTVGNLYGSIKSGGLDPLGSPVKAGRAIVQTVKAMRSYAKNPTGFGAPDTVFASVPMSSANIVVEAKRYGIDAAGFHGTEVDPIQKRLADHLLEQIAAMPGNSNYFSIQERVKSAALKFISVHKSPVMKFLGHAFDQNDRLFKIANWMALTEKFTKDPAKFLQLPPGTPLPQVRDMAKRLAAYRVNRSFIQPSMIGPGIDKIRKSAAGLGAKFFTTFTEDLRVTGDIPAHIAEEPALAWRLFKYSTAMAALFGGAGVARRLSGIPDEECTAALMQQTTMRKGPDFMQACLPWRDSKGRAQLWDMSSYLPITKYFQGVEGEPMFQRVLTNAFTLPVEGGGGEGIVGNTLSAFGARGLEGGAEAFVSSVRPGEAGVLNGLNHVWDKLDLGPQAITKEYDILRKSQVIGTLPMGQEPMTPGQAIGATFGGKAKGYTVGGNSPSGISMLKYELHNFRELKNSLVGIAAYPDDMAMKMLPQIVNSIRANPISMKDERLKATIAQMMQVAARIQALTAAEQAAEQARNAPPQILPDWAR